jgi:O-antigen/teichoic acid export membrane protein
MPREDITIRSLYNLFRDLSAVFGSGILQLIVYAVTLLLITRLLGPENYGIYTLFNSVVSFFLLFGATWVVPATVIFGREELVRDGTIRKVLWVENPLLVICLVVCLIAFFLFSAQVTRYIGLGASARWLVPLAIISGALYLYGSNLCQAIGEMQTVALAELGKRFWVLVVVAILIAGFLSAQVSLLLGMEILGGIGIMLIFVGRLRRYLLTSIEFDHNVMHGVLKFSWPRLLGSGSGYIVAWIDVVVIRLFLPLAQVGVYSAAYRVLDGVQRLTFAYIMVVTPVITTLIVQGQQDLVHHYIKRIAPQCVFLLSLLLSMTIVFFQPVFPLLFGRAYADGAVPLAILLAGLAFNGLVVFYTPVTTAYKMMKADTLINMLGAAVNILGDFILIRRIGIVGGAFTTALVMLTTAYLWTWVTHRRAGLKSLVPFLCPLPAVASLVISISVPNMWLRITGVGLVIVASWALSRHYGLFNSRDWDILESVNMPDVMRRSLVKLVTVLSKDKDFTHRSNC